MPLTWQGVALATFATSALLGVLRLDRSDARGTDADSARELAPAPAADTARADSLLALVPFRTAADSSWLARGLVVRMAPAPHAAAITTVSRLEDLEHRELSYEEEAIAVRGEAPGWIRIALVDGRRGWVALPPDLPVVALDSILPNSLAYLTPAWDRRVRAEPSRRARAVRVTGIDPREDEVPVEIVGTIRNADGLWWRVRVLHYSPCESVTTPPAAAEGWIPAWREGALTAEWYSRGC